MLFNGHFKTCVLFNERFKHALFSFAPTPPPRYRPSTLFLVSSEKKSLLHLAVIYSLKDMFDFLLEKEAEYKAHDLEKLLQDPSPKP